MGRTADQKFCSQRAMEQHRDAPVHSTMFSCDVCKRPFGSKQAVAQHRKSPPHARVLAQAKLAVGSVVGATRNAENDVASRNEPHTPTLPSVSIRVCTRSSSNNTEDECSDDDDDEDAWAGHSRADLSWAGWDDDQDWALCDKDCGWCGHCAVGVDY